MDELIDEFKRRNLLKVITYNCLDKNPEQYTFFFISF